MQPTETSSGSHHRILKGYEVCVHECVQSGCVSPKTQTLLWKREGHACRRHACLASMHPKCSEYQNCPGAQYLGFNTHAQAARPPTEIELTLVKDIPILLTPGSAMQSDQLDNKDDIRSNFSVSFNFMNVQQPQIRPFDIIFIPDPTLELNNKSKAANDLAFIQTTLSEYEYNAVKHLEGSVHALSAGATCTWSVPTSRSKARGSYKVCVQEWVSQI
jgi:hypothetical protein